MNIHAVSFGQEAFYKLLRQDCERRIHSFLLSSKISLPFSGLFSPVKSEV